MHICIQTITDVIRHKLSRIAHARGQCMRVEVDERADAVIKIDRIMHRGCWSARPVDGHGSSDCATKPPTKPIAHRLAEKRVSLA